MSRFDNIVGAVLAAALISLPSIAASTVMKATVKGHVGPNIGFDATGVFGMPALDLLGLPFSVSFFYDVSKGQRTTNPGVTDEIIGGLAIGIPSDPIVDTAMTINGTTVHIPTTNGHSIISVAQDQFNIYVASPFPSLITNHVILFLTVPGLLPSLDSTFSQRSARGGEDFKISSASLIGGGCYYCADGQLVADSLEIQQINIPVPEPETYVMLLTGLAFLGVIARRRKRALAS